MNISLIVPAYNEQEGIGHVIRQLLSMPMQEKSEIIVVDDGSTDRTREILESFKDDIKIISHSRNKGYGAALKTGIRQAKNDIVVITDADGTYPNGEIPKLVQEMKDNDMLVGARVGANVNIPMVRRPAKWILNKLANYLTCREIPDLNSGLRVMRKEIVESFLRFLPDGFSFTTTITLAMLTNNFEVKYIPINYHKREGKSKINPIKDTTNFLLLVVRTVLYFDPLKVFLPVSLIFMGASFLFLLYRFFFEQSFGVTATVLFICGIQLLAIGMIADLIDKRLKR